MGIGSLALDVLVEVPNRFPSESVERVAELMSLNSRMRSNLK